VSDGQEATLGWFARRMIGGTLSGLHGRLTEQAAEIARLHETTVDLTAKAAGLRETSVKQSIEIERLRIEMLTLERRLDGETNERTKLGQAMFDRIENARR